MPRKPDWWRENESLRREFDLPPYEPPQFADGTYVHRVVDQLKDEFDCHVQFIGVETRYDDDWEVRIDGCPAFSVGRVRNQNGNTIYQITATEFEARLRDRLEEERSL